MILYEEMGTRFSLHTKVLENRYQVNIIHTL
jgi:hypothetical protein